MIYKYTGESRFRGILILIVSLWSLIVFFPGSYSVDSWNQYNQMIQNSYHDWHAPVLPFIWRQLYLITGRFESIYVLQMVLYWVFVFLLLTYKGTGHAAFIAGILVATLLLFIPQYVMKDTHHAIAWALAIVLLIRRHSCPDRRIRIVISMLTLLLLTYGLFTRMNAVIALLPLLYVWLPVRENFFKKAGLVLIMFSLMIAANYWLTYSVLHAQRQYPEYKWKLLDIAGISKRSGINYFPAGINSYTHFSYDSLMAVYTPASIDDIYWPAMGASPFPRPDERLYREVSVQWKKAIAAHPALYLENRWEGFMHYLRIRPRFGKDSYWNVPIWIDPNNPLHLQQHKGKIQEGFLVFYKQLNRFHFFDPWVWLLLNMALCCIFMYRKRAGKSYQEYNVLFLIQLSAVLYMLSQFPVYQHDRDFRYNYYNVFAFFIGLIFLVRKNSGVTARTSAAGI